MLGLENISCNICVSTFVWCNYIQFSCQERWILCLSVLYWSWDWIWVTCSTRDQAWRWFSSCYINNDSDQTMHAPHLTSSHCTSPRLISLHLTLPHLTSPHLTSPHITTSPRLISLHLTSHHHLISSHLIAPRLSSPHLTTQIWTWTWTQVQTQTQAQTCMHAQTPVQTAKCTHMHVHTSPGQLKPGPAPLGKPKAVHGWQLTALAAHSHMFLWKKVLGMSGHLVWQDRGGGGWTKQIVDLLINIHCSSE